MMRDIQKEDLPFVINYSIMDWRQHRSQLCKEWIDKMHWVLLDT